MNSLVSSILRPILRAGGLCLALAAIGAASAAPDTDVVARLGTTDITVAQLRDFVQTLDPALRKQAVGDTQLMNRLVRAEIERMAVLREAKAQSWDQRPDVVAQIARARDQVIAATFLASVSVPAGDFPTDAQIQSAYDLNRDSFMVPRQYDLQQIYIALPTSDDKSAEAAAEKKAKDLAAQAKARNADFAALARQYSQLKDSAAQGGDMGWAPEPQIIPEIRSLVTGMSKGEVSDPIRTADGWHIVRLVDTKAAAPRPLAEVKANIVAALRQRKQQDNAQAYIGGLLDKNPISVNEMGLQKIFQTGP